jgi:hypothetical protein
LPDGIFSNQKAQFGQISECLAKKDVGIFYGHLVYFTAIWSISLAFGIFYGHLVYFVAHFGKFFPFWFVVPRKIWQP